MKTMCLPVELCQYVLTNKLTSPLKLFLALKFRCDGITKLNKEDLIEIGSSIRLTSYRAVKNNLNKLIQLNWVGYNTKTQIYFIRGFERIRTQLRFKRRKGAEFSISDIPEIKAFCFSSVVTTLINEQKRKIWNKEGGVQSNGCALQPPSNSFPVALKALSKILNISPSTAFLFKQEAIRIGYLKRTKYCIKSNIPSKQIKLFKKKNKEIANMVYIQNGKLRIRDIDRIQSFVILKRRKNIELY